MGDAVAQLQGHALLSAVAQDGERNLVARLVALQGIEQIFVVKDGLLVDPQNLIAQL